MFVIGCGNNGTPVGHVIGANNALGFTTVMTTDHTYVCNGNGVDDFKKDDNVYLVAKASGNYIYSSRNKSKLYTVVKQINDAK